MRVDHPVQHRRFSSTPGKRAVIRKLLEVSGMTIFTATVTMIVVSTSALGTNIEEFRLYNLGYFAGIFVSIIFSPQFSFIVIQYDCSQTDRLKMLLFSAVIVSVIITGALIFKISYAESLGVTGFLTGVLLGIGIYLNTETFATALRRQELKHYFWVRFGTIIFPFLLWGAAFVFLDAMTALLSFEISRGILLILVFYSRLIYLLWQHKLSEFGVSIQMLRKMASRHVIKLSEAVLIVLFPFLIMLNTMESAAPIRIGYQAGTMLGGIVGIVIIPRILRSERFRSALRSVVHTTTIVITLIFLSIGAINWRMQSDLFVSYSVGATIFIILPLLGICGALVLKFRGGGAVAKVWVGTVAIFAVSLVFYPMSFYQFGGGLWSISFGYSLIVQFLSPVDTAEA